MCRWAAYIGRPIFLEEIVSRPGHSLIHQSHCATECHSTINADGFGVAWYGARPEAGLYRDVMPAWSDPNLKSLTAQVKSGLPRLRHQRHRRLPLCLSRQHHDQIPHRPAPHGPDQTARSDRSCRRITTCNAPVTSSR